MATALLLEDHVTVRLPRLMTFSDWVPPTFRETLVLESFAASLTVTLHFRRLPFWTCAVIVHLPALSAVTRPSLTLAMPLLPEDQ